MKNKLIARIFNIIYLILFAAAFVAMWVLAIRNIVDFKGYFDWFLLIFLAGAVVFVFLNNKMNNVESKKDLIFIGVIECLFLNVVAGVMCFISDVDVWNGSHQKAEKKPKVIVE